MADYVASSLPLPLPDRTLLAPVGASPWRRLKRGLDPATELALALASLLDLEAAPSLLTRRGGAPQRGRGREERLRSPPSFEAHRTRLAPPGPVLLIDDVVTTGGTLLACAGALEAAGMHVAGAACFAWTPPPA
jgi:predicted amidophosphoribosyltransferase